MSKLKSKFARRIMAIVLSGAMVMSNMSAYAAELAPETEIVSEVEETAAAETMEDVSNSEDEKTEAETPTIENSERKSEEEESEVSTVKENETKDATEADSETEENSVAKTEAVSSEDTEIEETEIEETTVEEERSSDVKDEDLKEATAYEQGDWINNQRTTKWDFTAYKSQITIGSSEPVYGLLNKGGGTASWKNDSSLGGVLSILNSGKVALGDGDLKLAIPLDKDTVSVDMEFTLGSKTNVRMIGIGDGNQWLEISHNPSSSSGEKVKQVDVDGATVYTYSSKENDKTLAFATEEDGSKWLYVIVGDATVTDGKPAPNSTGETKFKDITIIEAKAGNGDDEPIDRGDWTKVNAPEIAEVTYDVSKKDTTISVKVKGVIDKTGEGADKLTVAMYDTNTITDETTPIGTPEVKTTNTTADDEGNHYSTVTFTPSKSGTYYFKATLERNVESDGDSYSPKSNTEENINEKAVEFKLPLKAPAISTAELKESTTDTITVSWNAIEEADYYEIAMIYSDEANSATTIDSVRYVPTAEESSATSFSKDIAGLVSGSTVKVTVQAFRGDAASTDAVEDIDKSDVSAERTVTLEEVVIPEGTKVFEAKNFTFPSNITEGQRIPLTTDGYFTLVAKNASVAIFNPEQEYQFDDGYTTAAVTKFGGTWNSTGNWIEFTTSGSAEIKVWWTSGSAESSRTVALYDASMGNEQPGTPSEGAKLYIDKFEVAEGGTYRIASGSTTGGKSDIRIAKIEVSEGVKVNKQYTFDGASVYTADIAAGTFADGDTKSYVDDYFTVIYSTAAKIEKKSYSGSDAWADEYAGGYRLNFGGTASTSKNAIKFTTTESESTIKVWWKAGADGRHIQILDASGNQVAVSTEESKKDVAYITKFKLTSAGTYYLGNETGNNYLFKVNVTEGHVEDPVGWDTVAAPVIQSAVQNSKDGEITGDIIVTIAAYIDELKGCEKVTVEMYGEDPRTNENAEVIATASSSKTTTSADSTVEVTFSPESSGNYFFIAKASRAEERETHDSAVYAMTEKFILPLAVPSITRATNDGTGGVEIAYSEVVEADKYVATAVPVTKNEDGTYTKIEGAEPIHAESNAVTKEDSATTLTLKGLTIGQYYAFTVHAVRGDENGKESEEFYKIAKDVAEQVWDYSAFGESTSTNKDQCGYDGDVNDGEVSVWSLGGKGKIVPASTDGIAYVYTKIDKDTNFVLEATAYVDEWTYSNGQDGFGLMVSDTVGPHGHSTKFWNNSYMAVATKMEYYWNGSTVLPTSVGAGDDRVRYNMYLGLGSIARTGVTDEWEAESAAGATIPSRFVSEQLSLEHAAGSKGLVTGDYNVIGNAQVTKAGCIDVDPLTEIKLRVEKNNTGYFITYIDKDGEETTHKYYEDRAIVDHDYANQSLLQIDKENIYVGFFAARNAKVTFRDITFRTSSVDDGGEPEEKPITYNVPTYSIVSGDVSNSPEYDINFSTNWNGTLSIKDGAGRELVSAAYFDYLEKTMTTVLSGGSYVEISMLDKFFEYETETTQDENGNEVTKRKAGTEKLKADVKVIVPINDEINTASKLSVGANKFTVSFTPDRSWHKNDDELQMLTSYATSVQTLSVNYRKYGTEGSNIYAAPDGKATGDGSKESPLDIFTATKYVQPGQTIVLLSGTYSLKSALTIERGVDGTAENPIRMIAEPGSYDRTNPFKPSGVVIDFNKTASGMTIAGDYWYFRGFDVVNSSDGNKGLQVSGSHNVLDQVNTYYNGNTGIQLSRYKGTDIDKSDDWPAYNLILNCTSYLNRDSGEEDADGFAAKLTIGDGNVFDGCIAAYNADDGWDFFAKSESGPIGQVIIKNSVTFKNGYGLWNENGELDVEGTEKAGRGNGNGFKMGGESIKGYHLLINSYSFYNKAKGIDSNSCPDIQAYNCVSFNNQNYNIAFYTGVASYTEYKASNLISLRTSEITADEGTVNDQLKPVVPAGATDLNDYNGASNFYWNSASNAAENKDGKTVTTEWFKSIEYKGVHTVSRNADGTINMGDFLAFSDKADMSVFVKLEEVTNENGIKSYKAVEGEPDAPGVGGQPSYDKGEVDEGKDTDGSIEKGDDDDRIATDVWTDEEFAQLDIHGDTLKILLNLDYDSKGYYTDYTGVAIKPTVRVAYGLNELTTKNYSISYKNNIKAYELRPGDAGFDENLAPTVIIKGKGNYSGEYKLYFVIKKIDMSSSKVTAADIYTVATDKAQKLAPAVTFDGKKLNAKEYTINKTYTLETVKDEEGNDTEEKEEKAYSGSYESAGTYYIELKGADINFTGTKTVMVRVLSKEEAASKTPMSKVKVSKILDQVYDGTPHRPAVTVTANGTTLTPSTVDGEGIYIQNDYDIAYYNNTDIGIASVVLTGNIEKGYYGTKTVTFKTIAKPFNIKDYSVTVKGTFDGKSYTATTDADYKALSIPSTGSAITFGSVVVKVISKDGTNDVPLKEGIDYTVSYKGNTNAGTASVVIKGMGDYKGSMSRSFKITPFEINSSNTTVEPIDDQEYAKGGAKPTVIVKVNGKVISSSNYTVSYKNNTKLSAVSGPATVSITGKKLLKGSLKDAQTFNVVAKNLLVTDITAPNVYYGTAKNAGDQIAYATKLTVKDGTKTISLNSDYTVTYYESDQFDEKLFDYTTGAVYINKTETKTNEEDGTSESVTTKVKGTPLDKKDKITYDGSNKTIYVVITGGKNGLYTGATYASYKVVGKNDIKYAKVTKITDTYTYNDSTVSAPKLEVKIQNRHLDNGKYVKDTEFTTLKLNEDYEIVSIKNNDRAGTATITIQGIGYYAGTNKAAYKIAKKDLTAWDAYLANAVVSNITVEVDEADVQAGGKYANGITFNDILIETGEKDENGNDIIKTEKSALATAAAGKIFMIGTKTSGTLTYGTDYTASSYSNNIVNVSSLEFDENGYAEQTASATITAAGSYTGSRTFTFTIRIKKTPETV